MASFFFIDFLYFRVRVFYVCSPSLIENEMVLEDFVKSPVSKWWNMTTRSLAGERLACLEVSLARCMPHCSFSTHRGVDVLFTVWCMQVSLF